MNRQHVSGCRCADCIDRENRVGSSAVSGDASEPAYHSLKTDPAVFEAVWSGAKTFEIRLNDRGFKAGDVLNLRETTHTGADIARGAPLVYTGREIDKRVSHVLTGYGLTEGWCCLSFAPDIASQASPAKRGAEPNVDDIHYAIDKALLAARRDQRDKTPETMAAASDLRTKAINAARALTLSTPSEKLAGAAQATMFKTTVLGMGPYCVEFPDGEIIGTRSEERQRAIAALAPSEKLSGAGRQFAIQLVRDICETDPADPGDPDTIFINVNDLQGVIEVALASHAETVPHVPAGQGVGRG